MSRSTLVACVCVCVCVCVSVSLCLKNNYRIDCAAVILQRVLHSVDKILSNLKMT